MAYMIAGKFKVEYDKKDNAGHVSGSNIFLLEKIESEMGEGFKVVTKRDRSGSESPRLYIPSSTIKFDDIQISKKCDVLFDQYGNIKSILF